MRSVVSVDRRSQRNIVAAGVLSLIAWLLLQAFTPRRGVEWTYEMLEAAERMQGATAAVARFCETAGIEIESADLNRTCLIGPEHGALFTSLGQLEAKRTSTNPDVAGLLVHILRRAGVSAGDTIAVGASASFPALLIATLSAAEAMGVHPVTILSLGASSYGATRPELSLLVIHQLLVEEGVISSVPAAVSLGGDGDVGAEFEGSVREDLLRRARETGIPVLLDPDLRGNVSRRMSLYLGPEGAVAAFVNIGGSEPNLGSSPRVLDVAPGLNTIADLPLEHERGVVFEMLARGVPVIHLLHVRGLALRHGLPWDPVPLPEPGTARLVNEATHPGPAVWVISLCYFSSLALVGLLARGRDLPIGGFGNEN